MERLQTSALVARRVEYGEADLICTLLTELGGKRSVLARSARRSRRRFGAGLSLFVIGEASLRAPARGGELWLLESFEPLEDLGAPISGDLIKMAHGSYLLELTRELWPSEQPEPAGFRLICEALRVLALNPPSPALLRACELRALAVVGLAPSLEVCLACQRPLDDEQLARFELDRGGVVCGSCGGDRGIALQPAARQELLALRQGPLELAARRSPPPEVARALRELGLAIVRHAIGKDLRSLQFILQLAGAERARAGPQ